PIAQTTVAGRRRRVATTRTRRGTKEAVPGAERGLDPAPGTATRPTREPARSSTRERRPAPPHTAPSRRSVSVPRRAASTGGCSGGADRGSRTLHSPARAPTISAGEAAG